MIYEIEINEKIVITTGDIIEVFSAEAGGFDYWGVTVLPYDENISARERIRGRRGAEHPVTYEEVAAEILESGGTVIIRDTEGEEGPWGLTLDKLLNGFKLNAVNHPEDADISEGDAETADRIMQYALFGDIVYG